jgi:hypothetical protein
MSMPGLFLRTSCQSASERVQLSCCADHGGMTSRHNSLAESSLHPETMDTFVNCIGSTSHTLFPVMLVFHGVWSECVSEIVIHYT